MTNNINMSYTLCLTLGKPNLDCAQGDKLKCSLINLQTQTLNVTFNPFTALLQLYSIWSQNILYHRWPRVFESYKRCFTAVISTIYARTNVHFTVVTVVITYMRDDGSIGMQQL